MHKINPRQTLFLSYVKGENVSLRRILTGLGEKEENVGLNVRETATLLSVKEAVGNLIVEIKVTMNRFTSGLSQSLQRMATMVQQLSPTHPLNHPHTIMRRFTTLPEQLCYLSRLLTFIVRHITILHMYRT